ncbi:unnamed protein product [Caenorhabditis brenneri]
MLFREFSILFLVAQCVALEDYTMITKPPTDKEMETTVLEEMNRPRRSVAVDTQAMDLYWLKYDLSLAWKALKTTGTCENIEDPNGFMQIRLRLSKTKDEKISIDDLWENLEDFTKHIKENGAEIDNSTEQFSKFYDYYRSDWKRIGCVFKICKDLMTAEETNLVCFLGPKSERKGPIFELDSSKPGCPDNEKKMAMCKEQKLDWDGLSEDDFQNFTLNEFNGARSKFALRAKATEMSKLTWDDALAQSAGNSSSNCTKELTHGSNYREVIADHFLDKSAGLSEYGDMYGITTREESYKEVYDWSALYTILWPKMTKVGCARNMKCSNRVICHFGDIADLDGKMYEKGETCSKCTGGCEEGLCI